MITHIEDNDGFTLDELVESIISEKIFNINEDKILTRLAAAIKCKISSIYDNTSTNIFVRASLADSTYKSQSNILFTTRTSRSDVNSSKPKILQKPTILNWFKRDVSKTVEKKEVKQECVRIEDQPSSNIIPVDIDPFGTLVITGDMLSFSSDDESNLGTERTHIKSLTSSSIGKAHCELDEGEETCLDYSSLNNCSTDECSQSSKSVDFDISDNVIDVDTPLNENGSNLIDLELTCDDMKNTGTCSNTGEPLAGLPNGELIGGVEMTSKPLNNSEMDAEQVTQIEVTIEASSDTQMSNESVSEPVLKDEPAHDVDSSGKVDAKVEKDVFYLGNNIIVLHGIANNTAGCYWLLSKVFECELKSLITNTYQENEFVIIQNRRVQHIDCTILQNFINDELIPIDKLKDILLNRHSQICVLEHFDNLLNNWQMLMGKWFSKLYEKLFIILCNNLNYLDFRVKSYSLLIRLSGLDRDRFIDYTHKLFLRSYNMPNKNYMNTRSYVMNANKNRYCLSRLNMIEIANRVDFDLILFFNTLVDAQRNYVNAIRKHKTKQSHKWLRNLIHVILHNSHHFVNLKTSGKYSAVTTITTNGGSDLNSVEVRDHVAGGTGENTPTFDRLASAQNDNGSNKLMNDSNKLVIKLITDIITEYGVHEFNLMLIDFYNRLMEMGSLELESIKPSIVQLISNMLMDKPLDDDLTNLEVKINLMKFLVYDIILLIQNLRLNSTS